MDNTLTMQEAYMLIIALAFWVLTILAVFKMKAQIFFQRAYIDIKGDFVDQILNLRYKHPKINAQLFKDLPVTNKNGDTHYLTITRVSKAFVTVYLNSNRQSHISETLDYLLSLAKELNLEVANKGYY
jgi:hypothetical protein